MNNAKVLVIGAGVSGLTAALKLLQSGHAVTIWSKEPEGQLPNTSANAYAIWVPVRIDADPRVEEWANATYHEFVNLAQDTNTGVVLREILKLRAAHEAKPWFADTLENYRQARPEEIYPAYVDGFVVSDSPIIDPPTYLRWLRARVVSLGGKFEQREVEKLTDCPKEFSVIFNCSGLGARKLVGDTTLFSQRVQVVKIKHNGWQTVVIDEDGPTCIVPHRDHIKLGAVLEDGDNESLEVDPQLTVDIIERCNRMVPGFDAKLDDVISVARALRPERPLTRVEFETLEDGRLVAQCYGHDGMGYLLSYGIAAYLVNLLSDAR